MGTLEVEISLPPDLHKSFGQNTVKTLLVRLFYPTTASSGSRPSWTGPGNYTIQGYSTFLGVNPTLLRVASYLGLKWTKIPAYTNAPLMTRPTTADSSGTKWPCCIFSHGLGGTRNAYSQISGSIASGGLVVMSIEHRDNSAAISVQKYEDEKAQVIEYVSIKESNSSTLRKRREQMAQRAYEVKLGVELFRAMEDRSSASTKTFSPTYWSRLGEKLNKFQGHLDAGSGRLIMAGHSMGAATAVHVCKDDGATQLPSSTKDYKLQSEFRAAILLDPWMEVLVDSTSKPLTQPTLAVASEAFHNWSGNWNNVVQLMKGRSKLNRLAWLTDSAHLSQSDFQLLFPTATKYAFKAKISPDIAMDRNVRLVRDFLREAVGLIVPLGKGGMGKESGDVWKEEEVKSYTL